jgi:glycosyltransferase involved in cell wall biosynthesis
MMNGDNHFTFIVPMFNASSTLPTMLHSVCGQSYDNWRIILIDDVSTKEHIDLAEQICTQFQCMLGGRYSDKIDLIRNESKKWEVANVLYGIKQCNDDDIVCRIDADDWLTDLDALAILDSIYTQSGCDAIWSSHRWGFTDKNISGPMNYDADPYKHPWASSHLKTFRKRLINGVPYENFLNMDGELVRRAGDQAIYLPVLRNAKKFGFLPRVLYHYTIDEQNGAVYQTDDAKFQKQEADFIRARGYVTNGSAWEECI